MLGDGIEGAVVTGIALVLPDVNCREILEVGSLERCARKQWVQPHTERVALANLCTPASNQMNLILWEGSHARIPVADELGVLVHLVRPDLVVDNAVDILATGNDLGEAGLNVGVVCAALGGAMNDLSQEALLTLRFFRRDLCFAPWLVHKL